MTQAKFTDFYKIVTPSPEATRVTDSQSMTDAGIYGNYSWYQRLIQGSGSRLTRYREYDLMDNDIDVARALDTIAEEMTGNDENTKECLLMDVVAEDDAMISDTEVLTVKAALRHWITVHKWDARLFKIARITAKYGDCFFRKRKEKASWEFVHPKHVIGAIVDKEDIHNILGWQVRRDVEEAKSTYGVPLTTSSAQDYSEIVPAREIVRFTLNDDMSDTAPFGESVLSPVYRSFKQKELLEDSVVIYRIQRAPERRVFYIDVGKMPPQRSKQYLEQIKNEIKQKKVPTINGGTDTIDSVYNPQSMSEDFFFAQRQDGRGSRVETLPGGQGLGELSDLEYFMDKVIRGLRIPYSYMYQDKTGSVPWNDGRVGTAHIQELRFALYIVRLQKHIEDVLDVEFKKYLKSANIIISEFDYRISLPEPSNFGKYRQQEMDAALLNTYASADGVPYLSKRFILERYLQLTDEEIIRNEKMLREEKGLPFDDDDSDEDLTILYGGGEEGGFGGGGFGGGFGGMGGMGPDFGEEGLEGGEEGDMLAGAEGGEAMPPPGGPEGPAPI
jgi:hypothetical protein